MYFLKDLFGNGEGSSEPVRYYINNYGYVILLIVFYSPRPHFLSKAFSVTELRFIYTPFVLSKTPSGSYLQIRKPNKYTIYPARRKRYYISFSNAFPFATEVAIL